MIKIKKLLAVVLAAAMTVCCLAVTAGADSIYDTAKAITSGKSYSTTLYSGGDTVDYKITVSKKGELKLDITAQMYETYVYVYDSDGNYLRASQEDARTGSAGYSSLGYCYCNWNSTVERFAGVLSYPVEKGTYYIRFMRNYNTGNGKLTFTATAPTGKTTASKSTLNYLSIPINVGSQFTLQAYGSAASGDKLTWTSSNTTVGTITSAGTFTAKKAGETIITAMLGSSTVKLHIKVVS